jgi:hypothetical protein
MKLKSRALGALAGLFAFAAVGGVANALRCEFNYAEHRTVAAQSVTI